LKETRIPYIRYAVALLLMMFLSSLLMLGTQPTEVFAGFTSTPTETPAAPTPTPTRESEKEEKEKEEAWDTPTPAPTPTPTPDKLLPEAGGAPNQAAGAWLLVAVAVSILGVVLRQALSRPQT
jgi:hypothetical protein